MPIESMASIILILETLPTERRINHNSYEIDKNHRQYNQQARLGYRINGGLHSYREEDEIISTYNFFDPSSNNNYFELVFANI
ncbi:MAG: hypothetical protein ACI8RD_010918 [Bacillariaceae sp.]|jgi:hypothetical protein